MYLTDLNKIGFFNLLLSVPEAPKPSSELPSNCNPNKCLNDAQCIEGKNTFFCVCPEHTYGRLCEKKIIPTNGK